MKEELWWIKLIQCAYPTMTRDEAIEVCELLPMMVFPIGAHGEIRGGINEATAPLRDAFPAFNWRLTLNRRSEHTKWFLTVDDDDPREHYWNAAEEGYCPTCAGECRLVSSQRTA